MSRRAVLVGLLAALAFVALQAAIDGAAPHDFAQRIEGWVARGAAPHAGALGVVIFAGVVLLASLVSEDATCIAVGLLVGAGHVSPATGLGAAGFALWAGDLLLYAAGRWLGARFLGPDRLAAARRVASGGGARAVGPLAIVASRFVPGTRLPTYAGAGALHYPFASFAFWLAVGAAIWTPLLVGGAAAAGDAAQRGGRGWLVALAVALVCVFALRLAPRLATHRGRRLLWGAWQRKRRWEFWPTWAFYAPLLPYFAWLALRHRSLTVVTAVNPSMPGGGLVGESKWDILSPLLAAVPERVARTRFVPGRRPLAERAAIVRAFVREEGLALPVVLKPDVSERGRAVGILRRDDAIERYLAEHEEDLLAQEYLPGREAGLFYVRHPAEAHGRLFSITDKRMISVAGDGRSTLEELILCDARAVCLAAVHLAVHAGQLARVPAAGEIVPLVEIGTHSRGALFLDGRWIETPALAAEVDRVSRAIPGFHLGRYDVRAPSLEALQKGEFRIVELNGLTAEPTHMYDPRHGLRDAQRVVREQWRMAFAIGAANAAAGARPASLRELWRLWRRARGLLVPGPRQHLRHRERPSGVRSPEEAHGDRRRPRVLAAE